MARNDTYEPRGKTAVILDRGYELVESVPYKVSARWVFYALLQEGFYSSKSDYKNKWIKAVSSARHAFYKDWRPDTLADETRSIVHRSGGFTSPQDWVNALAGHIKCNLSKWAGQQYYVQLWFEARAMTDQFRHYTEHVDLVPMGGQPSIPYKWDVAKEIEAAADEYNLPVVVLYFGDLDEGGETIARVSEEDVRKWCSVDFEFIYCGLTMDQVQQYKVPENFERAGYQWEALSDLAAAEIITGYTKQYLRHDAFTNVLSIEKAATDRLRRELGELAAAWGKSA